MKFSAVNKIAYAKLRSVKRNASEPWTKQGYSKSKYLPENTSTK